MAARVHGKYLISNGFRAPTELVPVHAIGMRILTGKPNPAASMYTRYSGGGAVSRNNARDAAPPCSRQRDVG